MLKFAAGPSGHDCRGVPTRDDGGRKRACHEADMRATRFRPASHYYPLRHEATKQNRRQEYHSLGAKDGLGGVAQPAGGAITTAAIPSYPAPLVGKLTAGVVEETVVMDIGVDPVVGMAPVVGAEMKKAKETAFRKRENACLMQKVTCTHFGDSFLLRQYVNQGRAGEGWCS